MTTTSPTIDSAQAQPLASPNGILKIEVELDQDPGDGITQPVQ